MKRENKIPCGECDEPILLNEPAIIYDDEWCHLHCAADAEDEADFDSFFGSD